MFLANATDIVAVTLTVLIVLGVLSFFIVKRLRGEKTNTCGCESKGEEMKKYYYKQKKKDEKKKSKGEHHSCCD